MPAGVVTPRMALISQRLEELAREQSSIADLAAEFDGDHQWSENIAELRRSSEFATWWAAKIRSKP